MADRSADAWYPTAAYLYVLHLDGPALAWEYLRRHSDYRRDWLRRHRQPDAAHAWGLRLLEDPALDARDAHPDWFPDPAGVLQLYPDADPPPTADGFAFWRIPGHKYLFHDGKRLVLTADWPGCCVRFALAPGLADGMAYLYAVRACASYRTITAELDMLATVDAAVPAAAAARGPRLLLCWNCTPCRRSTRPSRARLCAKPLSDCSARMPWPPAGMPTAACARACAA